MREIIQLNAAQAQLKGVQLQDGAITGFDQEGDQATWTFKAKAGIYLTQLRYCSPHAEKGFELVLNGKKISGMFAKTGTESAFCPAGAVELQEGQNTLIAAKGWGYFELLSIALSPAPAPRPLRKPAAVPADPKATAKTRALLRQLIAGYGTQLLSGQYDESECALVRQRTGKTPAILGADLMDYSPSRRAQGANPKKATESWIAHAKAGQILTLSWHWNAPKDLLNTAEQPWYKGFYTKATTFDVARALANPKGEDYALLLRDIDAIAVELKKLAAAEIPVLWRPLHEAEGGWFWWGAKGPEVYKQLWQLMFQRLTQTHQLHNLLWVHNCTKPAWYPGDAWVDVVGVDAYPSDPTDPLSATWEELISRFDGKKLLALTELGGVPDAVRLKRFGVRWAYFVSWTGYVAKLAPDELKRLYSVPGVKNR